MSVINKMLKDLEERQEYPEMGEYDAKFRPKEKSNSSKSVIVILSVVIIALVAALIWMFLLSKESSFNAENVKPELLTQKQSSAITTPVTTQSKKAMVIPQRQEPVQTQINEQQEQALQQVMTDAQQQNIKSLEPTKSVQLDNESKIVPEKSIQPVEPPIAVKKQQSEQAQPSFKIEKTASTLTPQQRIKKMMEKAKASFDKGYITESIDQLEKVLAMSDRHIEARNLMAAAWYGRGEVQTAVTILNEGLNRYPSTEQWRLTAAKIYFKENDIQAAMSYLNTELDDGSVEFYSMKGNVARQLQAWPAAESAYLMLTRKQADVANWWLGHAIALDSQEKSEQAELSYRIALAKGQSLGGISDSSIEFIQQRLKELKE